jgi:hypothetical protein
MECSLKLQKNNLNAILGSPNFVSLHVRSGTRVIIVHMLILTQNYHYSIRKMVDAYRGLVL